MEFAATYFDGVTAQPLAAIAIFDSDTVTIRAREGVEILATWPIATTKLLRNNSGHEPVFKNAGFARLRLDITPDALRALLAQYPILAKTRIERSTRWRLVRWLAGSGVAIALIFFVILPGMVKVLTTFMPRETEFAIGTKLIETVYGQSEILFGATGICVAPEGVAQVQKMTDTLIEAAGIDYQVEIAVLQSDTVNAFALPGGRMVILSGLIDSAESQDQVAAVLAHELGHVDQRHPLSATLGALGRSSILSIVLGDISGGVVSAAVVEALINAGYSRDVEVEADDYAIKLMHEVGLRPSALADFFDFLRVEYGDTDDGWQSFSSHPQLIARAQKARDADISSSGGLPNFSSDDWQALQDICAEVDEFDDGLMRDLIDRYLGDDEENLAN